VAHDVWRNESDGRRRGDSVFATNARRGAPRLRSHNDRVFPASLPQMNLPNVLTVSRVPLMFIIVALMQEDWAWAATLSFWLFIAAALTDWLDGKIARERGEVSSFGRFMDAVIDKVMVIGIMIALVQGGNFLGHRVAAMMLLLCILCREFAISGLRMAAAVKGLVVEADAGGKVKTFVQLNAIGWLMGARMLERDFGELFRGEDAGIVMAVRLLGIALFVLSAVLTVTSGISYYRRHGRAALS